MINSGNFAGPEDNNNRREHGVSSQADLLARAREQAGDDYQEEPQESGNGRGMGRRAFIIGAGVLGIGAIAGGWMLFGPKPKEEPKQEAAAPAPEPVVEEPKLPTRLACTGEPLTVGRDIEQGAWYAERFDANADVWLRVRREEQEWSLQKPQDKNNLLFWSNQIALIHLTDGDRVWANAVLTKSGDYNVPRANTEQIPQLRAGALVSDADIQAGTWEVTAKKPEDEIDPETHLAIEGDLTWSGRVTGMVSEWEQNKIARLKENETAPSVLEKCVGIIILDIETAEKKLGAMLGASTEFPAEEAAAKAAAAATNAEAQPPADGEGGEKTEEQKKAEEEAAKKKAEEEAAKKKEEEAAAQQGADDSKNRDFSTAFRDMLFDYFDGTETAGFYHVRDVDEVVIEPGQLAIPVMTSMILVEPFEGDGKTGKTSSTAQTTSGGQSGSTSSQTSGNQKAAEEAGVQLQTN